jgi:type VI secretion system protein ImpG
MDPRLLGYYNQELRYLREMGGEFARDFPKIASRLGMEGLEVADPYVERLIEGAAFLAARVQLKQDAEFPQLSQRLLEMVCPNLTAPTPSMLVAHLRPAGDPNLMAGFLLPKGSALMSSPSALSPTRCEFRTAQELVLTPLRVTSVEYFLSAADLSLSTLPLSERPKSGMRVRMQLPAGATVSQLRLDALRFYLGGLTDVSLQLHELLAGACVGVLAGPPSARGAESPRQFLPGTSVRPVGYSDSHSMLPVTLRGLSGVRLLQEYFAFAQRFLFFDVTSLAPALAKTTGGVLELVFLFKRHVPTLEGSVGPENFLLHCVPAINLFERRAERPELNDTSNAFHLVPERTAPADYEVFDILSLHAFDEDSNEQEFVPLFAAPSTAPGSGGYFCVEREPRLANARSRRDGPRSGYVGSEVFVSLVDPQHAPWRRDLRQLAARVRVTNRDLPLFIPLGDADAHLTLTRSAPVESIRVIAGPSRPIASTREGPMAWRLLSLLSLSYVTLLDEDADKGALALRDLLGVFAQGAESGVRRQVEGIRSVQIRPIVRRHPAPGPIAFGRGIDVGLTVDDLSFEGGSAVLLASVLHQYFSRHVSMNSFAQTTVTSLTRGEIMTWQPELGSRSVI